MRDNEDSRRDQYNDYRDGGDNPQSKHQQLNYAINILGILENLWYLIQNNMEDQVFQFQRMLADELNTYKR